MKRIIAITVLAILALSTQAGAACHPHPPIQSCLPSTCAPATTIPPPSVPLTTVPPASTSVVAPPTTVPPPVEATAPPVTAPVPTPVTTPSAPTVSTAGPELPYTGAPVRQLLLLGLGLCLGGLLLLLRPRRVSRT